MLREGELDEREVEIEVEDAAAPRPASSVFTPQGVEEMGMQLKDMLGEPAAAGARAGAA